jgi:hypothetical protein
MIKQKYLNTPTKNKKLKVGAGHGPTRPMSGSAPDVIISIIFFFKNYYLCRRVNVVFDVCVIVLHRF